MSPCLRKPSRTFFCSQQSASLLCTQTSLYLLLSPHSHRFGPSHSYPRSALPQAPLWSPGTQQWAKQTKGRCLTITRNIINNKSDCMTEGNKYYGKMKTQSRAKASHANKAARTRAWGGEEAAAGPRVQQAQSPWDSSAPGIFKDWKTAAGLGQRERGWGNRGQTL